MTKRSTTKHEALTPATRAARVTRRGRLGVLGAASPAWLAIALLSACGGTDTTCGAGTEKKGDTCVAKSAPQPGDAGTGGSSADASAGGGTSSGGASGSGGAASGGKGGASSGGKGGASSGGKGGAAGGAEAGPTDAIDFAGARAVGPADPGGTSAPGALLVTWQPASYPGHPDAVIRYQIFSATSAGNEAYSTPVAEAPPGATSALIDGNAAGAATYFVVRAVASVGTAVDKNTHEVSGTPAADSLPPTFAGAKAVAPMTSSSVLVSWDAASDDLSPAGAISYRVYWSETLGGTLQLGAVTNPGATEIEIKGLNKAEHQFFFRVDAVDAAGNVYEQSTPIPGSTGKDTTAPTFAGCRAALNPTASGGTILWEPASDDTTPQSQLTYNIYAFDVPLTKDSSFTTPAGTFKNGVKSGLVTKLLPAGSYRIVCRAVDSAGNEDTNRATVLLKTTDDADPPTFIAGSPSAVAGSVTVDLSWPQAHDNQTPDAAIQYVIYGATTAGGQDLTSPITTWTGTTSTTVMETDLLKALPKGDGGAKKVSNTDFYFVVGALDLARNASTLLPEVHVTTLISFKEDVQPVFTIHCALAGCHVHPTAAFNPPQGQVLEAPYTHESIVDVVAGEGGAIGLPNIKRIDSTSAVLTDSYLWRKINGGFSGAFPISGNQMPPPQTTGPQLRKPEDFDIIKTWILQGAKDN
jgi:hypothetical protein